MTTKPKGNPHYNRIIPDYRDAEKCMHDGPRYGLVNGEIGCALCVSVVPRKMESNERDSSQHGDEERNLEA